MIRSATTSSLYIGNCTVTRGSAMNRSFGSYPSFRCFMYRYTSMYRCTPYRATAHRIEMYSARKTSFRM